MSVSECGWAMPTFVLVGLFLLNFWEESFVSDFRVGVEKVMRS
jgi:hypothetical protein